MVLVFYMFGKPDKIASNIASDDKGSDLGSASSVRRQILWVRWVRLSCFQCKRFASDPELYV